jgi:hypothetical protein
MKSDIFIIAIIWLFSCFIVAEFNSVTINQKELTRINSVCKSGVYSVEINQAFGMDNKITVECKDCSRILHKAKL